MKQPADVIRALLEDVEVPGLGLDVVAAGVVTGVEVEGGTARLTLRLPGHAWPEGDALVDECREVAGEAPGVERVEVDQGVEVPGFRTLTGRPAAATAAAGGSDPWQQQGALPGVRVVVAVASGKGGVGKSTAAVSLATALAGLGAKVGLVDADIHGPSVPMMMGASGKPTVEGEKIVPLERHGVKVMSMGSLSGEEEAMVWRGPMVQGAIRQLLQDVAWGELDYLLVDMPPGTGDAQLGLAQTVPLAGAVLVTTPQDVALTDVRKGITMFRRVEVEILGLIENMAAFVCDGCGKEHPIFAAGGGGREAERQGVPLLASIPLDLSVREAGDRGVPVPVSAPEGVVGQAWRQAAIQFGVRAARRALTDPKRSMAV